MCIFSQTVRHVAETNIFARLVGERQVLVYEMLLASDNDLSMILPLPTVSSIDNPVSFINLSQYPTFFEDMARCFPQPPSRASVEAVSADAGDVLAVHRVGAFDASFVPSVADFGRLDERFRLNEAIWSSLPVYEDYGFAVFQLRAGEAKVHPMAMAFVARNDGVIYFPTTHVHDREVHSFAHFDHVLYAQGVANESEWSISSLLPKDVMKFGAHLISDKTRATVEPESPIARRRLLGNLANDDIWLRASAW